MSERTRERLDDLQERTDADSMSEVIRRALAAYEELVNVEEDGGRVVVEDAEGELEVIRVLAG